jgi:hypothetical protein
MEAMGFIISNFLVGLLGFGGSGRKKQLLRGLGLAFLSLFLIKARPSSMLQLMP